MQVTRATEVQKPAVRLHPKASSALGLQAERATPRHLGTQVPRTRRWHALRTGYARRSDDPLGFPKEKGTCTITGAQPPGVTSTSRGQQLGLLVLPGVALLGASSQVTGI